MPDNSKLAKGIQQLKERYPDFHTWHSWMDDLWHINESFKDGNPEIGVGKTQALAVEDAIRCLPTPHNNFIVQSPEKGRLEELRQSLLDEGYTEVTPGCFLDPYRPRYFHLHHSHHRHHARQPVLSSIKIQFKGIHHMSSTSVNPTPTPGPIVLTTLGAAVMAVVIGYDQYGNLWTGPMPAATFYSDDTAGDIVKFNATTGEADAVADGVANITASLVTAENKSLQDTETITVSIPVVTPPAPVLSSIKIAFVPVPAAPATGGTAPTAGSTGTTASTGS